MTTTDRRDATDAPAPSAAEQARLDRIENAPACDESAVERVARALYDLDDWPPSLTWAKANPTIKDGYRTSGRAAIDALKPAPGTDTSEQATCGHLSPALVGEQHMCDLSLGHGGAHQRDNGDGLPPMRWIESDSTEDALHRVLDLADAVDREIAAQHQAGELTFHGLGAGSVARRIRAAVAGPQRDHDEEGGQSETALERQARIASQRLAQIPEAYR